MRSLRVQLNELKTKHRERCFSLYNCYCPRFDAAMMNAINQNNVLNLPSGVPTVLSE